MTATVGEAPVLGRATRSFGSGALEWHSLVTLTVLVILLIPIRRFTLAGGLPFELEPYRVVVALVLLSWFIALLIDPGIRLRASGVGFPLTVFFAAILGSIVVNTGRIQELALQGHVLKQLMFFSTFILMLLMVVSVVRTTGDVDRLVRVLVFGGATVALAALVEYRTRTNLFDQYLPRALPFLEPLQVPGTGEAGRGGLHRTDASAEHPIALGAALVLLLPCAVYLAVTASRRWWLAAALLVLGAFTTVSRTSLMMLAVIGLVFIRLRPRVVLRLWPWAIPLLAAAYIVVPGALGTFRYWLDKPTDVVTEQKRVIGAGPATGDQGRLADIGPSLTESSRTPFLGQGFGTRISDYGSQASAQILDDQWLKTLLETGLIGVLSLFWLLARAIRRASRLAKADQGAQGWLGVAFAASLTAYAVSMFVYDSFSFIQSTYLMFFVLALSCVTVRRDNEKARAGGAASAPRRLAHSRG